jgi:hypothetical protein
MQHFAKLSATSSEKRRGLWQIISQNVALLIFVLAETPSSLINVSESKFSDNYY